MNIYGIIAEFNPLHNGHKYLIEKARENGATHIVAVMSGTFVQRGEPACLPKALRAQMAIDCGVDLVAELPVEFALSPANIFAEAGVFILSRLNANCICFGSECGDISLLNNALKAVEKAENSELFKSLLNSGCSYPRAVCEAAAELSGNDIGNALSGANNMLGIEYIRAKNKLAPNMQVYSPMRAGALHNSDTTNGEYCSASMLRRLINGKDISAAKQFMPQSAFLTLKNACESGLLLQDNEYYSRLLLYKLRNMSANEIQSLPDSSEGLGNRLVSAAKSSKNIDELFEKAKTKRYTMARIRRIAAAAIIGITAQARMGTPSYLRVLGITQKGGEILSAIKKTLDIPIGANAADLYKLAPKNIELSANAEEIYSLCLEQIRGYGADFTDKLYFKKIID